MLPHPEAFQPPDSTIAIFYMQCAKCFNHLCVVCLSHEITNFLRTGAVFYSSFTSMYHSA